MSKYLSLSLQEIHELLKTKQITPKMLVEEAFFNVEKNEELNAFITLNKEEALKEADIYANGDKVQVSGFGIFEVKEREARVGRNPRTKEAIEIPASKAPAFKASKALKDTIAK